NLTQGFLFSLSECVYPALYMQNHGNQLRLIYQEDGQTGTFVMNNDSDGTDNLYKAMFVDIDGIIGIKEYQDATSNIELSVYPNPASDYVSIELTEAANVTIYNSIGQVVKSVEHQGGVLEINTNNFNTGVYFVNANNGVVSTTQKLIVK
ncbi:MAG: T9SS type A sorting domain-containing protein, partial [Bacteroidales bacterium]|nr:T9SS type A sorting domain-containing protein [Bacteroidales bacterium]